MRQLLSDIALIPDDHRRGKTFERAVKWLFENAPETRNQFKKVWLWDDYPDRGELKLDLGIDLVAETLQGTRWAIQAKCYGPDQSLTWGDLSTFYVDAIGRTEIDQLLLVTTTDRISLNAKKKLDQSSKTSAIWARADLLQFSIDSSLEALNEPAITEKYEPRPHQREAIDDAVAHLKENERGHLLMACGTGKTLTGLWIREEMKAQRTVVFVPSIALLRQTWSSWNRHANEPFYSIAICSDAKATSRGKDAAPRPPTTDPDTIAEAPCAYPTPGKTACAGRWTTTCSRSAPSASSTKAATTVCEFPTSLPC
jgi:predicted helicase